MKGSRMATAKLSENAKGRPPSGRGDYYRKYINHEKLQKLKIHAAQTGRDPKSLLDDLIKKFLDQL